MVLPRRPVRLLAALLLFAGCGGDEPSADGDAVVHLRAWAHAGREAERRVLRDQVAAFNASRGDVRLRLTLIPEGSYNAQVQAAALADDLPDVLELDGPFVANYAWQGRLRPLDDLLPPGLADDLLPSIVAQGTWRGKLYAVGRYDSGLALFVRRGAVAQAGLRLPAGPADAWTAAEFDTLLARLAAHDPDGRVLDLKLNYRGEWFTYAFAPLLRSAGGGLVRREGTPRAAGLLDGSASVAAMTALQRWIAAGRVDRNLDDRAFVDGRVALSWVGHWEWPRYREVWGDDLALAPLPDLGEGTRTGQGSWAWGIKARCAAPEAAAAFLGFLFTGERILAMTAANAAVPGTRAAVAASRDHREGGALRLYVEQLTGGWAVPRPRTPAYPVITDVFQRAFGDLRHGAPPPAVLGRAAREIDRDVADNRGYRLPEETP